MLCMGVGLCTPPHLVTHTCSIKSTCTQVTISYIEEEEGYAARTAALREYGFVCTCPRCQEKL